MRKFHLPLTVLALTLASLSSTADTRSVVYNFQKPETLTPAVYPQVPENPDDRSSFHEIGIDGVVYTCDGVSLTVSGGISANQYTWRRGYDDTGTKRTTDKLEGTYYLSVRPSDATDPDKQMHFTVTAPDGWKIESVELRGQNKANTTHYMCLPADAPGTMAYDATTFVNSWTAPEGQPQSEVTFTCPRKRPDGVNISANTVAGVTIKLTGEAPVPVGLPLPFNRTFKSSADLEDFAIEDNNGDGKTWRYYSSAAQLDWPPERDSKDDWLITPPLALKAGLYYKVEIHCNGNTFGEQMEVFAGNAPESGAMSKMLLDEKVPNAYTIYRYWLKPDADGPLYIGIHGKMPSENYGVLKIKCISVGAPTSGDAPGSPTDFTCYSDASGAKSAELSFIAPSLDLDGNPLAQLDAVELYYGSYEGNCTNLIARFEETSPGQRHTTTFKPSGNGAKTFRVVGRNHAGEGCEMFTKGYIGINKPANAENVKLRETEIPGEVELTWDTPALDIDGNSINPALISYQITDRTGASTTVTGNSAQFKVCDEGQQIFTMYSVLARTSAGKAPDYVESNWVAVGTPESTPLREGFVGRGDMPLLTGQITDNTYGTAALMHEADLTGSMTPRAADGDNFFAGFYSYNSGDKPCITTGKINLAGLANPTATVSVLIMGLIDGKPAYGNNVLHIEVAEAGTDDFKEIAAVKVGTYATAGWHRLEAPLTDYAGKIVQLRLSATILDFPKEGVLSFTIADDLAVGEAPTGVDIAADAILVPDFAEPGREFSIDAVLSNRGSEPSGKTELSVSANGTTIYETAVDNIDAGSSIRVAIPCTLGVFDDSEVTYTLEATAKADGNAANNTVSSKTLTFHLPVDDAPEGLTAGISFGTGNTMQVNLSWNEPQASSDAPMVTEDFERATPWAIDNVQGWTFHDADGGPVGLPTGLILPGIDEGVTRMAYTVCDASLMGSEFAHSGTKSLASFYNFDTRKCSNVIVSPELSGNAQTVSVYAKCGSEKYYDTMRFLYSMESRELNTFRPVTNSDIHLNYSWAEYTVDLPEGTRFFAIEQTSVDGWVFVLDDITYQPAASGTGSPLLGYNVYRDGALLSSPETNTHADEDATTGPHTYCVTARYARGESLPSEYVTVDVPASVAAPVMTILHVSVSHGALSISNPANLPVDVHSIAGTTIAAGVSSTTSTLDVTPGMYIISAPGIRPIKVIVP